MHAIKCVYGAHLADPSFAASLASTSTLWSDELGRPAFTQLQCTVLMQCIVLMQCPEHVTGKKQGML